MRYTAMVLPSFGGLKSVDFRGKGGFYAARMPRNAKPMGSGSGQIGEEKAWTFRLS